MQDDFYHFVEQIQWKIAPQSDVFLAPYTSVKVGGRARMVLTCCDRQELKSAFAAIRQSGINWFILGKGTNVLVPDMGFDGVVLLLKGEFAGYKRYGNKLEIGAGAVNSKLAQCARTNNLSGTEFLKGIPGTVGGAVFMNAGAFGNQISDIVEWVEFVDSKGKFIRKSRKDLKFSYRRSFFSNKRFIITKISCILKEQSKDKIKAKEDELTQKRKKTQPLVKKTWGSVFLNPPGHSAGKLIESCDLKGKGIGKARICMEHANFIENVGGATFDDLIKTVDLARSAVLTRFGIELQMEGIVLE